MNIKLIVQSWVDSVKMLAPESLRHFALGSLNLLIRGFKSLALSYIVVVPILFALIAGLLRISLFSTPLAQAFPLLLLMFYLTELATMSVRPSVKIKNSNYYLLESRNGKFAGINRLLITIPVAATCWYAPFFGIPFTSLLLLIFHETQHNSISTALTIIKQFIKSIAYTAPVLATLCVPLLVLSGKIS